LFLERAAAKACSGLFCFAGKSRILKTKETKKILKIFTKKMFSKKLKNIKKSSKRKEK